MTILRSIAMAFLMFSKIPMPHVAWKDESMRYTLAFFPLVGVVIGALLLVWFWLCQLLGIGSGLFAAGLALIPLAVTGGIHIDGLVDTSDALGSHAEPERKREILKDSRVGAFGVIALAAYLLLYYGLGTQLPMTFTAVGLMACAHVLSRTTSGTISMLAGGSSGKGLLATFRHASSKSGALGVLIAFFILCGAGVIWLDPLCGALVLVSDALTAWYTLGMARRQFGGMSGDLAGWFLQVAEVVMLAVIVFTQLARLL